MRKFATILAVLGMLVLIAGPVAAATPTGSVGIFSVAACKDTTTVAVSGQSDFATNRLKVHIYHQNDNGDYVLLATVKTANFTSGSFLMPITLDYSGHSVSEGDSLRIDVYLQRLSGNSFGDVGSVVSTYVVAADKYCQNKCSVTITTSDRAPASGTITLRSHFGTWFRPEGWLHAAMPVSAGQVVHDTVVGVPCDVTVRAWYYPATGKDRTPKLLPAQYWPNDFAATTYDGALPYTTSFARGLAATMPLESDDPYAPK